MKKIIIDYSDIEIDDDVLARNSIVTNPAHQSRSYMFSSQEKSLFADEEKQMIVGVAMEADLDIFRSANEVIPEDHTVSFTAQTIFKIRNASHKSGNVNKVRFEHEGADVDGITLVESYIVGGKNNARLPEMFKQKVNAGSWILGYHVPDKELFRKIKEMDFGGFSVEVSPYLNIQNFNQVNKIKMNKKEKKVSNFWGSFFKKESVKPQRFSAETADGETVEYDGELAVGTVLDVVSADGEETVLADTETIITVDGTDLAVSTNEVGEVVAIADVEEASDEVTDAVLADFAREVRNQFSQRDSTLKKLSESFEVSEGQVTTIEGQIADIMARLDKLENAKGGDFKSQGKTSGKTFADLLK